MNVRVLAEKLGVSDRSVYRLIREGLIPANKVRRVSTVVGLDIPDDTAEELIRLARMQLGTTPSVESIRELIRRGA